MSKPKILIADDDPALVRAMAIRLEREGYAVITATDGYNALAKTVQDKPRLLILDINMPAGSGFSVQQRINDNPELERVPVIYVTGDTSDASDNKAAQVGAIAVFHKPIKIKALLATVERALRPRAA